MDCRDNVRSHSSSHHQVAAYSAYIWGLFRDPVRSCCWFAFRRSDPAVCLPVVLRPVPLILLVVCARVYLIVL